MEFTPSWLDPDDVVYWLRANAQPVDGDVDRVCAQTEIHVQRSRPEFYTDDPDDDGADVYVPDAEVYQGAVMFAARTLRRRNSPSGTESFGDGGMSFVARFDPDIDQALHTGSFTPPQVGG